MSNLSKSAVKEIRIQPTSNGYVVIRPSKSEFAEMMSQSMAAMIEKMGEEHDPVMAKIKAQMENVVLPENFINEDMFIFEKLPDALGFIQHLLTNE